MELLRSSATSQLILASFWCLVWDALYEIEEKSSWVPRCSLSCSMLCHGCVVSLLTGELTVWPWPQQVPMGVLVSLAGARLSASQEIPGSCRSRGGLWWHCCGLWPDVLLSLSSGARLPLRPLSQRGELPRDIHGI